jgi:hypothetical protein
VDRPGKRQSAISDQRAGMEKKIPEVNNPKRHKKKKSCGITHRPNLFYPVELRKARDKKVEKACRVSFGSWRTRTCVVQHSNSHTE